MGAGYVNLREKREKQQRKVGREEQGSSSNRPELAAFVLAWSGTSVTKPMLYLCDNQALLKSVKKWVGEGGEATLVGAPDVDILLEAIEELLKRTTAGAATFNGFWSRWKRIEENLQMEKPTSKQTRLFKATMFPRNGTTGQIEWFSHGKSLAGKEVQWAMTIESRRGTAGCGRRLDKDQQKRRCASTGIVWQELGNKSANKDDESM